MTHNERIAYAEANSRCFACKHYSGAYKRLSGLCTTGGIDPEGTAALGPVLTRQQNDDVIAWSSVSWSSGCSRFTAIQTEEA